MNILWLDEAEVKSLLTMDDAIKAVQEAFLDHGLGRTQMPPKSYLYFSKHDGDLRTMPAYLEGQELAGMKVVNVHPGNRQKGLPTVMALLILNSPQTGAPLAIMAATDLTAMRTGAAGAIAARYLARPESRVVGLVGAGAQARTQLMGLVRFFKLERVVICDISLPIARALEKDTRTFLDCDYELTTNPRDACECDILVTATPARRPVIKEEWIQPGTHINAIGADAKGKQELESALTKKARVVVDDMAQAMHSGEVNVPLSQGVIRPEDIAAGIGEILAGRKTARTGPDEITIFDSTGLGIQDVAAGFAVYRKALQLSMGTRLRFL